MGEALVFGLIGSSALVIGGGPGAYSGDPQEVPTPSSEAAEDVSGAEAEQTERMEEAATQQAGRAAVGFALLAAVTLDGVPENLALGVSLLSGGGSLALLVAIFCSNFPESLVGAVAMRGGGGLGTL